MLAFNKLENLPAPDYPKVDPKAFHCCECKDWVDVKKARQMGKSIYCRDCAPTELTKAKGPLTHNQKMVGKWIKIQAHHEPFKIANVTGYYYYGFTKSSEPRIINVAVNEVYLVPMDACHHCEIDLPTEVMTLATIDEDQEMLLCDSCLGDYRDQNRVYK